MLRVASKEVYDIIVNYVNSTQYEANKVKVVPKLNTTVCGDGRFMFDLVFETNIENFELSLTDLDALQKYCHLVEREVDRIWYNRTEWR